MRQPKQFDDDKMRNVNIYEQSLAVITIKTITQEEGTFGKIILVNPVRKLMKDHTHHLVCSVAVPSPPLF